MILRAPNDSLESTDILIYIIYAAPCYLCNAGCSEADLTDQSGTTNSTRCTNKGFVNSSFITGGVVCYNGTAVGSRAVYICNDGYNLMEGDEVTRVCQSDGNWNSSIPQCIPEEGGERGTYCSQIHQFQSEYHISSINLT